MNRNSTEDDIFLVLKEVLSESSKALTDSLGEELVGQLISSSEEASFTSNISIQERPIFKGYPSGNYLKQITQVVNLWSQLGAFPISYLSLPGFDTETTQKELDSLSSLTSLINDFTSAPTKPLGESLLLSLGVRGLLACLGIRKTHGSVETFLPPTLKLLQESFSEMHIKEEVKGAKLSVGARALTKHAHRCSDGFWGQTTGSESTKNSQAIEVLGKFMRDCIWINIHCLPGETPVLELRVNEGYGARWLLNKAPVFRGFLEPMMERGHERRWRH